MAVVQTSPVDAISPAVNHYLGPTPPRGQPLDWSEVTWSPCSPPSRIALTMDFGLITVDAAGGELLLLGDGERVEHAGSLPRAGLGER